MTISTHAQTLPHHVANMIVTVTAIVAVDSQPITQSGRGRVNAPITFGRMVIGIMTTISGTATTPFITALQNSALIGSMATKLMKTPISVAAATVP